MASKQIDIILGGKDNLKGVLSGASSNIKKLGTDAKTSANSIGSAFNSANPHIQKLGTTATTAGNTMKTALNSAKSAISSLSQAFQGLGGILSSVLAGFTLSQMVEAAGAAESKWERIGVLIEGSGRSIKETRDYVRGMADHFGVINGEASSVYEKMVRFEGASAQTDKNFQGVLATSKLTGMSMDELYSAIQSGELGRSRALQKQVLTEEQRNKYLADGKITEDEIQQILEENTAELEKHPELINDSESAWNRCMSSVDSLKVTIGTALLPVINIMAGVIGTAADMFKRMNDATGGVLGAVTGIGLALVAMGAPIMFVMNGFKGMVGSSAATAANTAGAAVAANGLANALARAVGLALGFALIVGSIEPVGADTYTDIENWCADHPDEPGCTRINEAKVTRQQGKSVSSLGGGLGLVPGAKAGESIELTPDQQQDIINRQSQSNRFGMPDLPSMIGGFWGKEVAPYLNWGTIQSFFGGIGGPESTLGRIFGAGGSSSIFSGIFGGKGGGGGPSMTGITGMGANIAGQIVPQLTTAMTRAKQTVQQGINQVVNFFKQLPGKVVGTLTNFKNLVQNNIKQAWDRAKQFVQQGVTNITNYIRQLLARARQIFEDIKNTIINKVQTAMATAKQWVIDRVNDMVNTFWWMVGQAQSAWDQFKNIVINAIQPIMNIIRQLIALLGGGGVSASLSGSANASLGSGPAPGGAGSPGGAGPSPLNNTGPLTDLVINALLPVVGQEMYNRGLAGAGTPSGVGTPARRTAPGRRGISGAGINDQVIPFANWVKSKIMGMIGGFFGGHNPISDPMGAFAALASKIIGQSHYEFYWGFNKSAQEAAASLGFNCCDGANLICALASALGLPCEIHAGFWNGFPHDWATVSGQIFDTTAFQKRGSWSCPGCEQGGGPAPSDFISNVNGGDGGRTVVINHNWNGANIYGIDDLESKVTGVMDRYTREVSR